jgi:hypothetical protein
LFALFSATESADAWLAWIASFVPIRPVRHPVRAAVSSVAAWEVALAVVIISPRPTP